MREFGRESGTPPPKKKRLNLGLAEMQFPAVLRVLLALLLSLLSRYSITFSGSRFLHHVRNPHITHHSMQSWTNYEIRIFKSWGTVGLRTHKHPRGRRGNQTGRRALPSSNNICAEFCRRCTVPVRLQSLYVGLVEFFENDFTVSQLFGVRSLQTQTADLPSLPHLAGDSRILEPSPAHPPRH